MVLLSGCGSAFAEEISCPTCVCAPCVCEPCVPEQVIREVEVTRTVDGAAQCELGPWTIQQTITQNGQYLVPKEMQPGQWAYQADDPDDECWNFTYSDLSGTDDSRLDYFHSKNKGFFVLSPDVKMVQLEFGPCTWSRIGD